MTPYKIMNAKHRRKTGSMLFVTVCVVAVILIPLLILFCQFGVHVMYSGRAQNVVEAAGKIAAIDLSRIVINDPDFGFVSLSNHPAVGQATRALDGEPLPVIGINTLVGTLRQNAIVAEELRNETMKSLIDNDLASLDTTIENLNAKLQGSLSDDTRKTKCIDIHGKAVDPLADVAAFLSENLPKNVQLESVKLSLGWLEGGSETTIALPQPTKLARVRTQDIQAGQYQAFTDYPVGKRTFSFAGLDSQTHLVSKQNFQEADGKHICSIVKIECTLTPSETPDSKIQCISCSQAFSQPDLATHGSMTVRFPGKPVSGLLSWREFLTQGYFQDNKVTTFDVVGGDYPFDKESRMQQSQQESQSGTSQQFAEHLYCWLRNGRSRARIDAILSMIDEPFRPYANEVYTYEFAADRSISRRVVDGNRFTRAVTADGQFASMADTRTKSGANAIILFRDNVRLLSTDSGKHGGQPLAGYPLGNSEGSIDHEQLALNFCQRKTHPYGLALDIEIGGTGDSTARNDVVRMRQRTASRKI